MSGQFNMRKFISVGVAMLLVAAPLSVDIEAQTKRQRRQTTAVAKTGKNNTAKSKTAQSAPKGKKTGQKKKQETAADVKKREEATRREIQQTKERIEANDKKVRTGLAELSRLHDDIAISDKRVLSLNGKVSDLSGRITGLEKKIEEGNREIERMRGEYLKAIKKMRSTRGGQSMLSFIFSAENFNQGLRRMRYLREFSKWKENRSADINRRARELESEARALEQARKEQQSALAKQKAAKLQLEEQSRRQDALVANLRSEGAALNAHLTKKQAEANQLKGQIAALIAAEERKAAEERRRAEEAERRKAAEREAAAAAAAERAAEAQTAPEPKDSESKTTDKPAKEKVKKRETTKPEPKKPEQKKEKPKKEKNKKEVQKKPEVMKEQPGKEAPKPAAKPNNAGSNFATQKGSLPRPVDGHFRVTSPFGRHALPELPDVVYDNPGIDVEVSAGASAKAVYAGKVSGVYMIPGFGNVVIINHGNYYTVYGNLASVAVKMGDEVSQGRVLGKVAPDPDNSSHGAFHFEVWRNRDKLDPSGWIR